MQYDCGLRGGFVRRFVDKRRNGDKNCGEPDFPQHIWWWCKANFIGRRRWKRTLWYSSDRIREKLLRRRTDTNVSRSAVRPWDRDSWRKSKFWPYRVRYAFDGPREWLSIYGRVADRWCIYGLHWKTCVQYARSASVCEPDCGTFLWELWDRIWHHCQNLQQSRAARHSGTVAGTSVRCGSAEPFGIQYDTSVRNWQQAACVALQEALQGAFVSGSDAAHCIVSILRKGQGPPQAGRRAKRADAHGLSWDCQCTCAAAWRWHDRAECVE